MLPGAGPGLCELAREAGGTERGQGDAGTSASPMHARAIAAGLAAGELSALYLLHCDPLRELPGREQWQAALARANTVIAHTAFLTVGVRDHADVVFPAESYAEKEGTVVHPDGRLQRLRPAIARPGAVRAEWQVLAELALALGADLGATNAREVSQQLFAAVPFYAGLTLEEIGGGGVRWQEREAARAFPQPRAELGGAGAPPPAPAARETAEPAAWRSLWDAPEVEFSPALAFLSPRRAAGAGPARNGAGDAIGRDRAAALRARRA